MSHLMLSSHGIWYYRRVYLTPRKRREVRISLRTRSKREALSRVDKYLTSQPFPCVSQAICLLLRYLVIQMRLVYNRYGKGIDTKRLTELIEIL